MGGYTILTEPVKDGFPTGDIFIIISFFSRCANMSVV